MMTRARALFAIACTTIASCGLPRSVAPRPSDLEARKISSSPGVDLVAACTPSGPELCFNAVDDNCNGVLDEGCGVSTGILQFMIAWGDVPADVDLAVTVPSGERVDLSNRTSTSQLRLERDCPSDGCNGQNIENAYFDGLDPARGRYVVEIRLKKLQGAPTPVVVRFGARVGGRTFGADVPLREPDERRAIAFDL